MSDGAATDVTRVIAEFAVRPRTDGGPTLSSVQRVLIDTTAVAMAGMTEPSLTALLAWAQHEHGQGSATVWGTSVTLPASAAALVNGSAAHVLDWDDASPTLPMHPGAVLLPALVAVSAEQQVTPARFAAAFNVGAAVFRAVSEALPLSVHYGRGWHNTSTTGRLAATSALAHLQGLTASQTAHALGMAVSLASGTRANFGSATKALHAGFAAKDAVMVVDLVQRGIDANSAALTARGGFFDLFGATTAALCADVGQRLTHWEHEWVNDWAIKVYPSCFATHHAIDAALALRPYLVVDEVIGIEVTVHPQGLAPLLARTPRNGLEAKFSMAHNLARALIDGSVTLRDFEDDRSSDPAVAALAQRVTCREEPSTAGEGTPAPYAQLTIRLRDGSLVQHRVDVSKGDARQPLSAAEHLDKVTEACGVMGWSPQRARALVTAVEAQMSGSAPLRLQQVLAFAAPTAIIEHEAVRLAE